MVNMEPIMIEGKNAIGIEVNYPKTRLLSITVPDVGYLMCGVLNVKALDELHKEREIIAAKVTGVGTLQDILSAEIVESTDKAKKIGIDTGITGEESLKLMFKEQGH